MHVLPDANRQCCWGCEGAADCIEHYVQCGPMHWLARRPRELPSSTPLVWLGLGSAEQHATPDDQLIDCVRRMAVAFNTYHIYINEPDGMPSAADPQQLFLQSVRCRDAARARIGA